MSKKIILHLLLVLTSITTLQSYASSQVSACESLLDPFATLVQQVLEPTVNNPPQVQLCHRVANAAMHYEKQRTDKSIDELTKFINETQTSTPKFIDETNAGLLIAEAQRIIDLIKDIEDPVLGQVSGGVFTFETKTPVPNALVTLSFLSEEKSYTTYSDANGLFQFDALPPNGTFIVSADDNSGGIGSVQGEVLQAALKTSVSVLLDQVGIGAIQGNITTSDGSSVMDALVTAYFPDTTRQYTVAVEADGTYSLAGMQTDGTIILIAFDNATGASGSVSSVLTSSYSSQTINLQLEVPSVINDEIINTGFSQGTTGWEVKGPVVIVDRDIIFSSQN
ncbi:carboxypeptidase-like regulatory domain-containing protein [Vibrio breoganii]|uniref:carboxypeptidase-like regulatory domain-containing protein n=1 Tax=Vibrio breoganii TaxID=553239 RepID=UPI000C8498C8|nr:carboxypeptidase-like regulatory domain-containing protein [Vibrio breoganii]PMG91878.1 hypothetical protein BCU79_16750 [Vibrio breoganii]PMM89436.1 hypothetical protein BCT44_17200 [Vibrio breoganii]TKF86473.1 carboxypeptidase regulatory-like domain-containing protein [Vibrio breoganii]